MNRLHLLKKIQELDQALNDEKMGGGYGGARLAGARLGGAPLAGSMYGNGLQSIPTPFGYGGYGGYDYGGCDMGAGARKITASWQPAGYKPRTVAARTRGYSGKELKDVLEDALYEEADKVGRKVLPDGLTKTGRPATRLQNPREALISAGISPVNVKLNKLRQLGAAGLVDPITLAKKEKQLLNGEELYRLNKAKMEAGLAQYKAEQNVADPNQRAAYAAARAQRKQQRSRESLMKLAARMQ